MIIAGKFKDYYDVILRTAGVDKTVVYDRTSSTMELKDIQYDRYVLKPGVPSIPLQYAKEYNAQSNGYSYHVSTFAIGFCGKIFPGVHVSRTNNTNKFVSTSTFYDPQKFKEYMKANGLSECSVYAFYAGKSILSSEVMKNFFYDKNWNPLLGLFAKHKVPVFIVSLELPKMPLRKVVLELNPQLKKYDFVKVMDPVSAFQNLYLFIAGVLGSPDRPTVKLSDKEMAKKRGHDDRYSFRKTPTKKKGKVKKR